MPTTGRNGRDRNATAFGVRPELSKNFPPTGLRSAGAQPSIAATPAQPSSAIASSFSTASPPHRWFANPATARFLPPPETSASSASTQPPGATFGTTSTTAHNGLVTRPARAPLPSYPPYAFSLSVL